MPRHSPLTLAIGAALLLGTAAAAHAQLAPREASFLRDQAQGTAYELAIARLASDKATKPDIKDYARMLVADHTQLDAQLKMVARDKHVDLPTDMTAKQKADLARLQGMDGTAFDKAYLDETTRINTDDKKQDQSELSATTDTTMHQFVEQLHAADAKHEAAAKALKPAG